MKRSRLAMINFMALCCVLGLFCKKLINPFANFITDALHIPGGISTGFSLMFLVIAAEITQTKRSGILMGTVQGLLALALGRIGSMGVLSPIGYMVPGLAIDLVYTLENRLKCSRTERMVFANALAAVTASLTANLMVFHLRGPVLWLYLCVSAASGTLYGFSGSAVAARLDPVFYKY